MDLVLSTLLYSNAHLHSFAAIKIKIACPFLAALEPIADLISGICGFSISTFVKQFALSGIFSTRLMTAMCSEMEHLLIRTRVCLSGYVFFQLWPTCDRPLALSNKHML